MTEFTLHSHSKHHDISDSCSVINDFFFNHEYVRMCVFFSADGVMRTMSPDKLLKGMPTLQSQIDALLEFDVSLLIVIITGSIYTSCWLQLKLGHSFVINKTFIDILTNWRVWLFSSINSDSWGLAYYLLALLFQVHPKDLVNGVINAAFLLLFKDLIKLYACYNDGIINLLGKFLKFGNVVFVLSDVVWLYELIISLFVFREIFPDEERTMQRCIGNL